ncbi:MAG: inositol monophosphatase family protein [Pseudomonadota bacterium]
MDLSDTEIEELRRVAAACADAAAVETLKWFRATGLRADDKDAAGGFDPVTEGDRAAEAAMRRVLVEARPDDAILGEEEGFVAGTSGLTWVLDPIDGTRGYVTGTPTWGTLIAVGGADGPLYGIVDQPYIGERFEGGFGSARFTGPHSSGPLATSKVKALSDAVLFTTFPEVGTDAERAAFEAVARQVKLTRYGMDCYAYALVAAGHADLVIEAGLQAYDIQGPMAVVQAAGGVVTNWEGGPVHDGGRAIAAATPELHRAALAMIKEAGGGV